VMQRKPKIHWSHCPRTCILMGGH